MNIVQTNVFLFEIDSCSPNKTIQNDSKVIISNNLQLTNRADVPINETIIAKPLHHTRFAHIAVAEKEYLENGSTIR